MSERRYTESQMLATLRKYWPMGDEAQYRKYLSTLTPDPEPSGEVVEPTLQDCSEAFKQGFADSPASQFVFDVESWFGGKLKQKYLHITLGFYVGWIACQKKLSLTAEVTRQVEERTRELREALSNVSKAEQAVCYSQSVALTREFELMSALRQCGDIARQVLANKGGSD